MLAFDTMSFADSRVPDGAAAREVTSRALQEGLVILTCGTHGETVRLLVPLTIPDPVLTEGLDMLERALVRTGAAS